VNPNKEKLKKEIEKKAPALAFPLDDKYFAFNYNAILDVMFNDDYDLIYKNRKNYLGKRGVYYTFSSEKYQFKLCKYNGIP
jgi:hypothetical protein